MKESVLKYLFLICSVLILFFMLLTSRDAGITCDEVLHYNHSVSVYNFFATHGKDLSSLDTPVSNLKYYGQSYDNLVTILIKWFKIDNIYGFRHIMSPLAGWLSIMITAFFAVWLTGYRSGILVITLFAVSPTFLGHSQNNLKDIPFALGYISSIYYICRFAEARRKIPLKDIAILTLSMAFALSIRAGGLLLICYFFLFIFIYWLKEYINGRIEEPKEIRVKLIWMVTISVASWLLSIALWPYALQSPVLNVLKSYQVMAHFPGTFRQIFEGKTEWSDFMPWYYLPKSMAITIPILVLSGFMLFFIFSKKIFKSGKVLIYSFILFSIFFPIVFVILEKSNLYSSWRQFLFLYPSIVLISAMGIGWLFDYLRKVKYSAGLLIFIVALLSVHPLKFMAANHRYSYIYYNQLVGGLYGACGNYETDYYYVSQTEASDWLLGHIKEKKGEVKIKATYSVNWFFRNHPEIETSYFRFEERSLSDWDYAIVGNRYISPYHLKNKSWPPDNAIHTIYADGVPVCAILERRSKDDYYGYTALIEGKTDSALRFYENVMKVDMDDEMIYYNYSIALYTSGQYHKADSVLKKSLEINPEFEPALMYLGNIARSQNNTDEAIMYYQKVINADRKYLEAYVGMAELMIGNDMIKARNLLRTCLRIEPGYIPAITTLADTYRESDPEIARKYDELADSLKH